MASSVVSPCSSTHGPSFTMLDSWTVGVPHGVLRRSANATGVGVGVLARPGSNRLRMHGRDSHGSGLRLTVVTVVRRQSLLARWRPRGPGVPWSPQLSRATSGLMAERHDTRCPRGKDPTDTRHDSGAGSSWVNTFACSAAAVGITLTGCDESPQCKDNRCGACDPDPNPDPDHHRGVVSLLVASTEIPRRRLVIACLRSIELHSRCSGRGRVAHCRPRTSISTPYLHRDPPRRRDPLRVAPPRLRP